jgi:hypothetical protein
LELTLQAMVQSDQVDTLVHEQLAPDSQHVGPHVGVNVVHTVLSTVMELKVPILRLGSFEWGA